MYGLGLGRFDPVGVDTSPLNIPLRSINFNSISNTRPISLNKNSKNANDGNVTAAPMSVGSMLVAQQVGSLPPLPPSQLSTHLSAHIPATITNIASSLQQENLRARVKTSQAKAKAKSHSPPQHFEQLQQIQQLHKLQQLQRQRQRQQSPEQLVQSRGQGQQLNQLKQINELNQLNQLNELQQQLMQVQKAEQLQQLQQEQQLRQLFNIGNIGDISMDISKTKSNASHGSNTSEHSIKMPRKTSVSPNASLIGAKQESPDLQNSNCGLSGHSLSDFGLSAINGISGISSRNSNSGMNLNLNERKNSNIDTLDKLKQIVASNFTNISLNGLISNNIASIKANPIVNIGGCHNCQMCKQQGFNVCSSCGRRLI